MKEGIDERMLDALELLYYVNRFRDSVFGIIPHDDRKLLELLPDLRIIQASGIGLILCCRHRDGLEQRIKSLNTLGHDFAYVALQRGELRAEQARVVEQALGARVLPILAFSGFGSREEQMSDFHRMAFETVASFGVAKVFFCGKHRGLEAGGVFYSYPTRQEVENLLASGAEINIGADNLRFLCQLQEASGIDLVVLEAARGELFHEIFTHRGAGTLFSRAYENRVRCAREADVRDIYFLMQPYLRQQIILPVTPEDILEEVESYYAYTVNEQIIAAGRCKVFGDACEIGKLCSLPRYQGRGRARLLVKHLIEMARQKGKHSVFALTTSIDTGDFFRGLGFEEVPRQSLPESWQRHYDFSRPSKAYSLRLD